MIPSGLDLFSRSLFPASSSSTKMLKTQVSENASLVRVSNLHTSAHTDVSTKCRTK